MDGNGLLLAVPVGAVFVEFHRQMHLVFAIGLLGIGGRFRPAVIDGDVLKQVVEQILKIRRRDLAKIADKISGDWIGSALKGIGFHEFRQSVVDLVFADVILQGVHHQRTFVVVDVTLGRLDPIEWLFFVIRSSMGASKVEIKVRGD